MARGEMVVGVEEIAIDPLVDVGCPFPIGIFLDIKRSITTT